MILIPYAFFDPPQVINTATTNIPGSGSLPLQVIANSGVNIGTAISFIDSTNQFIGVYIGSAGQEQLVCVIGNGLSSQSWGRFPANSRVSLRSMTTDAINNGSIYGALVTS